MNTETERCQLCGIELTPPKPRHHEHAHEWEFVFCPECAADPLFAANIRDFAYEVDCMRLALKAIADRLDPFRDCDYPDVVPELYRTVNPKRKLEVVR